MIEALVMSIDVGELFILLLFSLVICLGIVSHTREMEAIEQLRQQLEQHQGTTEIEGAAGIPASTSGIPERIEG